MSKFLKSKDIIMDTYQNNGAQPSPITVRLTHRQTGLRATAEHMSRKHAEKIARVRLAELLRDWEPPKEDVEGVVFNASQMD